MVRPDPPLNSQAYPGPDADLNLAESVLAQLEERHHHLCTELTRLERQLREIRTAAELCPQCGGTGQRLMRGGLYGELQGHPCPCRGSA